MKETKRRGQLLLTIEKVLCDRDTVAKILF